MGLLGSVPWSLNCGYYKIISLQLWNMTCYCTVHGPSMEAPSNKLQVVHAPYVVKFTKSNSKIQHQKQSFLGKLYSIMAWNWHEWIPLSVLSTVEVFFINNIAHIYVSTEAVWRARWIIGNGHFHMKKCPFPICSVGPTYCFRGHSFLCKLYSIMTWNWREWIPLSVLSTVEVFSSTILHIFTCPRKQYEGPAE